MSAVIDQPKEVTKPARRVVAFMPAQMQLAEQRRQDWVLEVEEGTQVEDLLSPDHWAHVAFQFQRFDRVEVRIETGEWLCGLIVVQCARNWARMKMIEKIDFTDGEKIDEEARSDYEVKYRGSQKKWSVIRKKDGQVLQEGMPDRLAADTWRAQYETAASR